jgi:murein DD-endopeptidase MepM/ murein hydrolase activator NlpD
MKRKIILIAILVLAIVATAIILSQKKSNNISSQVSPTMASSATPVVIASPSPSETQTASQFADPVANYKSRVTKKPFGIYVTPQNSPIQPERFTGYHTGADAEYQDVLSDVPVYAIADGKVVLSETASGYGGVFMISFNLNGTEHTALYGHIRPSSLPSVGKIIKKGDQLGLLGTGYTSETDGERRHLHFAILSDNSLNIKGYVQSKFQLSGWIDPLTVL